MSRLVHPDAMSATRTRETLIDWYRDTFVPAPELGHGLMNPPESTKKYITKHDPLTREALTATFHNATRYLTIGGHQVKVPRSYAAYTTTTDGRAKALVININHGGRAAVTAELNLCTSLGLWAFAQLSTSRDHDGGHVYVLADNWQPASLFQSLARQIQAVTGVRGEVFPAEGKALRLPLMSHLWAPGGPCRYPILLQSGELIETINPWQALQKLRDHCPPNTTEALVAAMLALPAVSVEHPSRLHKSKVNPYNGDSVIAWYNTNHSLEELLHQVGAAVTGGLGCCPFHDDQHPSLAIWQLPNGKEVCRCLSAQSNCPAAEKPYLDAFDVFCLIEHRSHHEVIADLIQRHNLGERRAVRIEERQPPVDPAALWPAHEQTLEARRHELLAVLRRAIRTPGRVTVIRGTPGIGKTRCASELANEAHRQGKKVAVVAGTHEIARTEWAPRLEDAMIWQSRTALCADHCCSKEMLETLPELGYALPQCKRGCAYQAQEAQREGHIVIYQYHHLHLNGGELLKDADLIIVDESPLTTLLPEKKVMRAELQKLLKHRDAQGDPAATIVQALIQLCPASTELSGAQIWQTLVSRFGAQLTALMELAEASPAARRHPAPEHAKDPTKLPRLFLGDLLVALKHDAEQPNSLLRLEGDTFSWYEKRPFLTSLFADDVKPAVIMLDGSAHPLVSEALYAPWPVDFVEIVVPTSPYVTLVQCAITPSTRRVGKEQKRTMALARSIATVCNTLGITLGGGVTYKCTEHLMAEVLGGSWLHYYDQRGKNRLAQASAIACVASPTLPPGTALRYARALWSDDPVPLDEASMRVTTGLYRYADPRVEAVNRMQGLEELQQAIHRSRVILRNEPVMVLVFSPWDLSEYGLAPHLEVKGVTYANSTASHEAIQRYQERAAQRSEASLELGR